MRLPQAPMAQAVGGPMMMGPGGQNMMGQRIAQNDLAQRGFLMQPELASTYGALGATKPWSSPSCPAKRPAYRACRGRRSTRRLNCRWR